MEFKGTKGDWCYNHNMVATLEPITDDTICLCPKLSNDKWEANAQLISNAPKMLEMLNRLVELTKSDNIEMPKFIEEEIEQLIKDATEL